VQTHLDPTRIVASLSSLFSSIRGTASDQTSMADTTTSTT